MSNRDRNQRRRPEYHSRSSRGELGGLIVMRCRSPADLATLALHQTGYVNQRTQSRQISPNDDSTFVPCSSRSLLDPQRCCLWAPSASVNAYDNREYDGRFPWPLPPVPQHLKDGGGNIKLADVQTFLRDEARQGWMQGIWKVGPRFSKHRYDGDWYLVFHYKSFELCARRTAAGGGLDYEFVYVPL